MEKTESAVKDSRLEKKNNMDDKRDESISSTRMEFGSGSIHRPSDDGGEDNEMKNFTGVHLT